MERTPEQQVRDEVLKIRSSFTNRNLELAKSLSDITLEGDNIDAFIMHCYGRGYTDGCRDTEKETAPVQEVKNG